MRHPFRTERGLALIMVLWSMALLALLAAMVMQRSTADLRLARNLAAQAEAELAADAVARLAAADIASGTEPWPPDPAPRAQTFAGARVLLRLEDEMGRIDLNAAEPELLAALMVELGAAENEAERLAAAIADYRDGDSIARRGGAEDPDYAAAGLPLGARDAYFGDPAELGRVLGVPVGLRRAIAPHLTTLTGLPEPMRWSASEPVQRALDRVEAEEEAARLAAGEPRPPSSRVLVLPSGQAENRPPQRILRITAEARTPAGARFVREAVFDIVPGPPPQVRVELWRRGAAISANAS